LPSLLLLVLDLSLAPNSDLLLALDFLLVGSDPFSLAPRPEILNLPIQFRRPLG
jgi:hypothetical protein